MTACWIGSYKNILLTTDQVQFSVDWVESDQERAERMRSRLQTHIYTYARKHKQTVSGEMFLTFV